MHLYVTGPWMIWNVWLLDSLPKMDPWQTSKCSGSSCRRGCSSFHCLTAAAAASWSCLNPITLREPVSLHSAWARSLIGCHIFIVGSQVKPWKEQLDLERQLHLCRLPDKHQRCWSEGWGRSGRVLGGCTCSKSAGLRINLIPVWFCRHVDVKDPGLGVVVFFPCFFPRKYKVTASLMLY